MGTRPLQSDRGIALTLAATCVFFALWSASCGGGGGSSVTSTPVAGFNASTNTLSFPNVVVVAPAPAQGYGAPLSATVTNSGGAALSVTGIALSGTNPADFTYSTSVGGSTVTNCGGNIAASGGACTITVTFAPTAPGVRSAIMTFTDSATTSPQQIQLSGTGTAPAVQLAQSLPFGGQLVGSPVTLPVTLTNNGTAPLSITANFSISPGANSADFSQTNNCVSPVNAGASCTVNVTFTPSVIGSESATLTVADNNNGVTGSTNTVALTGTGNGPQATLPASTTFPSTQVGSTSASQNVTLTNTGNTNLTINSNAAVSVPSGTTNPFTIVSSTCTQSASIVPTGTCTVAVTFTPVGDSQVQGTLTFYDNSLNNPNNSQTYALSGTGTGANPVVSLSPPTTLAFGSQTAPNSPSGALSVTLTNTGNNTLYINSTGSQTGAGGGIAITGAFLINTTASTCSTTSSITLATAGSSCTVAVQFEPTTTGPATGTLTFTDNNGGNTGSTQQVTLTGQGTSSTASISPLTITFPNEAVNSTSPAQTITLANGSLAETLTLGTISSAIITGTNNTDFAISSGTGSCSSNLTLSAGQSCFIYLTFTPLAEGNNLTASFNPTVTSPVETVAPVTLTGTGTGAVIGASPTSWPFGGVTIGTSSSPETFNISNTGNASLSITSFSVTGTNASEFNTGTGTTCSTTTPVAAGSSCNIAVIFSPTSSASVTGTNLTIVSNSTVNPTLQIPVSGSGTGPTATLSPTSLSFSSVALGSNTSLPITLTNNGSSNLTYSGTSITGTNSGDYSASSNCPSSVAPNTPCTITVTFTPATPPNPGTSLTASLSVTDNAASNTPVSLTGTGTGPLASLTTSATMTFSNQAEDTTSAAQTATLTNNGNAALTISSIAFTDNTPAAFLQTNNCPASTATLAAGASCTISVTFDPPTPTSFTAYLTVTDNSGNQSGSTQTLSPSLSGNGTGAGAVLSTASYSFGSVDQQSVTSSEAVAVLSNNGTAPLTISGSDFSLTGTNPTNFAFASGTGACPYTGGTVAVGASCTIYMTFNPTAVSAYGATVNISDNGPNSPQTVSLTGSGVSGISISPSSLTFTSAINTASAAQSITVTNPSGSPTNLTINSGGVTITGSAASNFTIVSNTCNGTTQTAGQTPGCSISVEFTPSGPGTVSAAISIADNLPTTPQTVTLSGTGTGPSVSLSPTSYNFAAQNINSGASTAELVSTVTNNGSSGTDTLTISGITSSDATEFALATGSGQCTYSGQTLAAGASCKIYATFNPNTEGGRSSTISIADNAPGTPQTVLLTGTGEAPIATLSTSSLSFSSSQPLGQTTAAQTVTLTNNGNIAMTLSGPVLGGSGAADFQFQTSNCSTSLGVGSICSVSVTFSPQTPGSLAASLTFTDNTNLVSGTIQTVNLSGGGNGPTASVPSTLSFGNQTQNVTSAPNTVTVSNLAPSTATLTVSSLAISGGTNPSDFVVSTSSANTCTGSGSGPVAIGSSCSFSVTFTPSTLTTESANLVITDNAYPTTQTVMLSGTGVTVPVSVLPNPLVFPSEAVTNPTTAGTAMAIALTNTSTANTLALSSIQINSGANPGDFALSTGASACSQTQSLAVYPNSGDSCNIWVTFAPSATGSRSATLTVTDNASLVSGSTQTVTLQGTGASGGLQISSSSLTFGTLPVGQTSQGACSPATSPSNCVTVTNNGSAALSFSSIQAAGTGVNSGQFSVNSTYTTCSTTTQLAINGSCVVNVTFAPTTASASPSSFSASLTFTDSASTSPQSVSLTGTGDAPEVTFSPLPFTFANQATTITSTATTVTLTNSGNTALTIYGTASPAFNGTNPGDFAATANTCVSSSPLAANGTCTYTLTFTPGAAGSRSANFNVLDNVNNVSASPYTTSTLSVSGTGLHTVVLKWSPSTTYGVASYNIYRGTSSGGETLLSASPVSASSACSTTTPVTCTFADDTFNQTITSAITYYYYVTAIGAGGSPQSPPSPEIMCPYTASGSPQACTVTGNTNP